MRRLMLLMLWCLTPSALAGDPAPAEPRVASGHMERLQLAGSDFPERSVDVWLPASYDGKAPHAVLYMHDGQMLFDGNQTWNKQEWQVDEVAGPLIAGGQLRPFIVVGVHNGGANRPAEYLPQQALAGLSAQDRRSVYQQRRPGQPTFLPASVYSDAYLQFLVQAVKPAIDRRYRTLSDKDNTFVMGSSMGGLISWYAAVRYPQVFGGVASLSTHWLGGADDNDLIFRQFLHQLASLTPASGVRLYFDHGDQTLDALYPKYQQRVDAQLRAAGWRAPQWQSRAFPGAAHDEKSWAARLDQPLRFLLGPASQN